MNPPVIIHVHIYKNAGSSIVEAFRRCFQGGVAELESKDEYGYLTPGEIESYLAGHPETVVISSHTIRLPLPETLAGRAVLPLVFLRDPIDRLGSVYRFERSPGKTGAVSALARSTSLAGFLETLIASGLEVLISNVHLHFLNGDASDSRFSGNLGNILLGLVEDYDASMAVIEHELRRWYPHCILSGPVLNVTRASLSPHDNIRKLLKELGPDLFGKLVDLNQADIGLYRAVAAEIAQRKRRLASAEGAQEGARSSDEKADGVAGSDCPSIAFAQELFGTAPGRVASESEAAGARPAGDRRGIPVNRTDAAEVVKVVAVGFGGEAGNPWPLFKPYEAISFRIELQWLRPVASPIIGLVIRDRLGAIIWGMNTLLTAGSASPVIERERCVYCFKCVLPPLNGGVYAIELGIGERSPSGALHPLMGIEDVLAFGVEAPANSSLPGVVFVPNVELIEEIGEACGVAESDEATSAGMELTAHSPRNRPEAKKKRLVVLAGIWLGALALLPATGFHNVGALGVAAFMTLFEAGYRLWSVPDLKIAFGPAGVSVTRGAAFLWGAAFDEMVDASVIQERRKWGLVLSSGRLLFTTKDGGSFALAAELFEPEQVAVFVDKVKRRITAVREDCL